MKSRGIQLELALLFILGLIPPDGSRQPEDV